MAEKALALWLAELFEADPNSKAHHDQAAAELRRLHAVNAELLEALKDAAEAFEILANGGSVDAHQAAQILRSDIAKAEGA